MEFNNLSRQYDIIKNKVTQRLENIMQTGKFIMGGEVTELEAKLAEYTGAKYAISCANGTDALTLALMAIDLQAGDEVIMPAFTYFATAEATALLGGKCVFVDIEEENYNIDPEKIIAAITPKTKAIIAVSLFGQCSDMGKINEIAKKYNIIVIEDAAQSFGAKYKGKMSCNLSDIACTSFFPSKPLGCYGDGGMCFTSNENIAKKLKMLRIHGQSVKYQHDIIGMNSRLDTMQAAILLEKFAIFEDEAKKRNEIGQKMNEKLQNHYITPQISNFNDRSVFAQYVLRGCNENRTSILEKLKILGIPTAIYYPIPLPLQPAFANLGYKATDFPTSSRLASEVFSVPFSAYLSEEEMEMVISALIK